MMRIAVHLAVKFLNYFAYRGMYVLLHERLDVI